MAPLYLLFFLSGFPALIYQIVWQRALFTIFGVNIESVTVVVSAFLLGLGIGSLAGGRLSRRPGLPVLGVFGAMELGIAAYGLVSLPLFRWVAGYTAGASTLATFLLTFVLVFLPTLFMGATLPLLVTHLVRLSGDVGRATGALYFVNTLGSSVACFVAALWSMRALGMSGSVQLAAGLNVLVGVGVLLFARRVAADAVSVESRAVQGGGLGFRVAIAIAFATGFLSLGYEIVWYRLYSFTSGGSPRSFAFVLGAFLAGIAFGSLASRWIPARFIGVLMLLANLLGFAIVPLVARAVVHVDYTVTLPLIAVAAGLLGATFPLLCHAAVDPEAPGAGLSYLYLSNIAGSALGSYVMGFLLMDLLTLRQISVLLLVSGLAASAVIAADRKVALVSVAACALGVWAAEPLFHMVYERLMWKAEFDPADPFTDVVETRSGVVTVDSEKHIYGGGAHDGVLSADIASDSCVRPYSLSYIHPNPKEVLLIGVAGGAWTRIVGDHPQVKRAVAVEINPGYLQVISRYPDVAPMLTNPKVQVVLDDGRRWLSAHPQEKFDAILMDTVRHWRASATNLLSVEMMRLAQAHLKPGGVVYCNTTYSDDAQKTAASVFANVWRFGPFLALSDAPLQLDERRWRATLGFYGMGTFEELQRINEIAGWMREADPTGAKHFGTESGESVRRRTSGARIITDDNMAPEWGR